MVKTGYEQLANHLRTCFFGAAIMHFAFVISSVLVALLSYSNSCQAPLRSWLGISAGLSGALLVFFLWKPFIVMCFWVLWHLVWSIVGAFWLAEGDCLSDFQAGYTVGLSIIVVNFGVIAVIAGFGCLFSIALCVGYGLSARYQEMTQ
jgi:hypothetical protein